jgi:hypothetical protein
MVTNCLPAVQQFPELSAYFVERKVGPGCQADQNRFLGYHFKGSIL